MTLAPLIQAVESAHVECASEFVDHALLGFKKRTQGFSIGLGAGRRGEVDAVAGGRRISRDLGVLMAGKPDGCWRCEGVEGGLGHGAAFDASARAASSLRMSVLRPSAV